MSITRRVAVAGIASSLALISVPKVVQGDTAATIGIGNQDKELGIGASVDDLQDQLLAFFGTQTASLLPNSILDPEDTSLSSDRALIFDQFVAVFGSGPAEHDHVLDDGTRMVVRFLAHNAMYKAVVFLEPFTSRVLAAAMTYYYAPAGGVSELFAGKTVQFSSESALTVKIFYKDVIDVRFHQILRDFMVDYPMPGPVALAALGKQKGPRLRFLVRRV